MIIKTLLLCLLVLSLCRAGEPENETATADTTWPAFRGHHASGVSDGQNLPDTWDVTSGEKVRWGVRVPGLAHSSPIVWGEQVFVTSAVSSRDSATFRHGLYGDGDASEDRSVHQWLLASYDAESGDSVWQTVVHEGVPQDKRHIKASYANSTPATNGQVVVAFFGSEGVFALDMSGNLLWRRGLGRLNAGAYDAPGYEWGTASSPIIYKNVVIVQCDTQGDDFIIALDIESGETVWRTERDEFPSWGTPTIYPGAERSEVVTNASNFIRGYDPESGAELWRLGGSSKITAPTPIFIDDLIIVASGRSPEKPIFAIRAGANGDITLPSGEGSSAAVAWSKRGRGPYMPTPIIYDDNLFVLNNNGVFDGYDVRTGEEKFRQRITHSGGGFSASPVASDGRLFLAGEDGDLFVVEAAEDYTLIARNNMGELLMATPAIASQTLFVRGEAHLFAIGK